MPKGFFWQKMPHSWLLAVVQRLLWFETAPQCLSQWHHEFSSSRIFLPAQESFWYLCQQDYTSSPTVIIQGLDDLLSPNGDQQNEDSLVLLPSWSHVPIGIMPVTISSLTSPKSPLLTSSKDALSQSPTLHGPILPFTSPSEIPHTDLQLLASDDSMNNIDGNPGTSLELDPSSWANVPVYTLASSSPEELLEILSSPEAMESPMSLNLAPFPMSAVAPDMLTEADGMDVGTSCISHLTFSG